MKKVVFAAGILLLGAVAAAALLSPRPARETFAAADTVILSDYGGRVAVFRPEESAAPRQVTAIEIRFLPGVDQTQLRRGIPVEEGRALAMLLEDLGS